MTVEGTGFASVQPNAAGDQHQPAALDLTSGTLRVTSGAGSNEGSSDTQVNALTTLVDASRSNTVVQARLTDPLADLAAPGTARASGSGPAPTTTCPWSSSGGPTAPT